MLDFYIGWVGYFLAIAIPVAIFAVLLFLIVRDLSKHPRKYLIWKILLLVLSASVGFVWLYLIAWAVGRFIDNKEEPHDGT